MLGSDRGTTIAALVAMSKPPSAAAAAAAQALIPARVCTHSISRQWHVAMATLALVSARATTSSLSSYWRAAAAGGGPPPNILGTDLARCWPSRFSAHERTAGVVPASAIRRLGTTVKDGEYVNPGAMLVLGIETSCDDTGAAVVSADGRILGEAIASQAELLAEWGGVVPKLAQEEHRKFIDKVVAAALQNARVQESDLSAVAVTVGPGLGLCLGVGVRKARIIARDHQLPLIGIHHMEAHALVVRLSEQGVTFPFVALLVSGGHNLLLLAQNVGEYIQLGTTIDDAIGEAYDKTARWLGLDLKRGGGPALEELALEGNANTVKFSVPMKGVKYKDCNFSYAGLKNQVRMAINTRNINGETVPLSAASIEDRQLRADIAASFQMVAVQHLEEKSRRAIEWARKLAPSITNLVVAGGVACNRTVRGRLKNLAEEMGLQLVCPPPRLCTDNGVMVAWAGVEHLRLGMYENPPPPDEPDDIYLDLRPRWQLGEILAEGLSEARSLKNPGNHPSLTAQIRSIIRDTKSKV